MWHLKSLAMPYWPAAGIRGALRRAKFSKLRAQARAQAGPKPGPCRAQARFLEIWKSGAWKSGNLGSNKIQKIKILKIQIRSAQNVGKVWISRKTILLAAFGPIWAHFLREPEKSKRSQPDPSPNAPTDQIRRKEPLL